MVVKRGGGEGEGKTEATRGPPLSRRTLPRSLVTRCRRCLTTAGPSNLRRSLFLTPLARVGHKGERERRGRGVERERRRM